MNAVTPILRLHEHRLWANRHLRDVCHLLTTEQLRQTHAIGQGTIWKTLCHMYAAEYVWLAALEGIDDAVAPGDVVGKLPGNQEGEDAADSLKTLFQRWDELDLRWERFLDGLTSDMLTKTIYRKSSSSYQGQRIGSSMLDVLLHVATHAHYTTAQAINMLRHSGVENLPPSMIITLARGQAQG